ncbi:hypothetical protein N7466_002997 [Penicillium verhagenii]|uniref:uncharacterized protein n=1 Tax=Penicillium verhagenii TaxID=1562060 RepID=UPI00254548F4|nr:uncharacterized protein N7466_002997 [Penicillium verhagenii]KAJ5936547.1 hypothetical protein N7466_002997 [Penicillium verhagenii]
MGTTRAETLNLIAKETGRATVNLCKILGFATSDTSSVNNEATRDRNITLSESFLAGLLRRYPGGKIFNFDANGSISSNETSDSMFKSFNSCKKYKRTQKSVLQQDTSTLLQIAPNTRSIIFSPVWDSYKTRTPQRVFTFDDEITFFTTFGSSLITESNLLAGLSHKLRSPLHGIFSTVELLSDTVIDSLQRGFVHTITSYTNTLLRSINQLLEFSSINDFNQKRDIASLPSLGRQNLSTSQSDPESSIQVDITVEDTIKAIFTGFCFFQTLYLPLQSGSGTNTILPRCINLILNIDKASSWNFITHPSALHIILTNIMGNALKYTHKGYISVQVKANPIISDNNSVPVRSGITISVQDTGCGIDPEFLRNSYFTPFSQENNILPRNSLGASITQKTIQSIHRDVEVHSQKGIAPIFEFPSHSIIRLRRHLSKEF